MGSSARLRDAPPFKSPIGAFPLSLISIFESRVEVWARILRVEDTVTAKGGSSLRYNSRM